MKESCVTCRFWQPYKQQGENVQHYGRCRAHPPRAIYEVALGNGDLWPSTEDEDWCGEYVDGTGEAS